MCVCVCIKVCEGGMLSEVTDRKWTATSNQPLTLRTELMVLQRFMVAVATWR